MTAEQLKIIHTVGMILRELLEDAEHDSRAFAGVMAAYVHADMTGYSDWLDKLVAVNLEESAKVTANLKAESANEETA